MPHQPSTLGFLLQGALVANYPWDGSDDRGAHYSRCPDDAAYAHLAAVYAGAHAKMRVDNREFAQGVTNGAAWYPLWGGMQVRGRPPGAGVVGSILGLGLGFFKGALGFRG